MSFNQPLDLKYYVMIRYKNLKLNLPKWDLKLFLHFQIAIIQPKPIETIENRLLHFITRLK